jgi:hypothetical protein
MLWCVSTGLPPSTQPCQLQQVDLLHSSLDVAPRARVVVLLGHTAQ